MIILSIKSVWAQGQPLRSLLTAMIVSFFFPCWLLCLLRPPIPHGLKQFGRRLRAWDHPAPGPIQEPRSSQVCALVETEIFGGCCVLLSRTAVLPSCDQTTSSFPFSFSSSPMFPPFAGILISYPGFWALVSCLKSYDTDATLNNSSRRHPYSYQIFAAVLRPSGALYWLSLLQSVVHWDTSSLALFHDATKQHHSSCWPLAIIAGGIP